MVDFVLTGDSVTGTTREDARMRQARPHPQSTSSPEAVTPFPRHPLLSPPDQFSPWLATGCFASTALQSVSCLGAPSCALCNSHLASTKEIPAHDSKKHQLLTDDDRGGILTATALPLCPRQNNKPFKVIFLRAEMSSNSRINDDVLSSAKDLQFDKRWKNQAPGTGQRSLCRAGYRYPTRLSVEGQRKSTSTIAPDGWIIHHLQQHWNDVAED